jgi:hypothetical protein
LISTVEKTIAYNKGEIEILNKEKFEVFKKKKLADNDNKYDIEIREKYGESIVLDSNERFMNMSNFKEFKLFNITYNLGLHITLVVFIVRGVTEVLGSNYSRAFDKSISGIAGIGHILLATGIITILIILNKSSKKLEVYNQ